MLNQAKTEPNKTLKDKLYDHLKENKNTWFSTDELGKIFDSDPDDISKYLNKLLTSGCLVMNKWENVKRKHQGKLRNARRRLWKADLD